MPLFLLTAARCAVPLLAALFLAGAAHAAALQVKTQAPGWYRMMLGDFEITALSDGTLDLPVDQLLTNTTPAKTEEALLVAAAHLASPGIGRLRVQGAGFVFVPVPYAVPR